MLDRGCRYHAVIGRTGKIVIVAGRVGLRRNSRRAGCVLVIHGPHVPRPGRRRLIQRGQCIEIGGRRHAHPIRRIVPARHRHALRERIVIRCVDPPPPGGGGWHLPDGGGGKRRPLPCALPLRSLRRHLPLAGEDRPTSATVDISPHQRRSPTKAGVQEPQPSSPVTLGSRLRGRTRRSLRPIPRHPDESQDPEPLRSAFVTLDPDFRQDDGAWW